MAEWMNALALKASEVNDLRGFESFYFRTQKVRSGAGVSWLPTPGLVAASIGGLAHHRLLDTSHSGLVRGPGKLVGCNSPRRFESFCIRMIEGKAEKSQVAVPVGTPEYVGSVNCGGYCKPIIRLDSVRGSA
jgi:hypothetical protein